MAHKSMQGQFPLTQLPFSVSDTHTLHSSGLVQKFKMVASTVQSKPWLLSALHGRVHFLFQPQMLTSPFFSSYKPRLDCMSENALSFEDAATKPLVFTFPSRFCFFPRNLTRNTTPPGTASWAGTSVAT